MPDDQPPAGKKVAGIPVKYIGIAVVAGAAGFGIVWLMKRKKAAASSSSTTTVITGSASSQTGISASVLNAILKDWQQNPPAASSSTATGTGGGGSGTGTGTSPSPTHTTTTTTKAPAPKKVDPGKTTPVATRVQPGKKTSVTYTEYTVKPGQNLDQIAKQFGITPAQLAHSNTYAPGEVAGKTGQTLGTGAGLKSGQVLKIPHYHTSG